MRRTILMTMAMFLMLNLSACVSESSQQEIYLEKGEEIVGEETEEIVNAEKIEETISTEVSSATELAGEEKNNESKVNEQTVNVIFKELEDAHTLVAEMEDGSTECFQFSEENFGEAFSVLNVDAAIRVKYRETLLEENLYQREIIEYYGRAYPEFNIIDAGCAFDVPKEVKFVNIDELEESNQNPSVGEVTWLEWRKDYGQIAFYKLELVNDQLIKTDLLYKLENVKENEQFAFQLYLPETLPNVQMEVTDQEGKVTQYQICSDLSGFSVPVCFVDPQIY